MPCRVLCVAAVILISLAPSRALALERLCDPAHEDCRSPLITLIRNETVAIDVAFWFMEDTRYATELIRRWQAGVPVRVLMDTQAVSQYGYRGAQAALDMLRDAGIPMREKSTGGILHWKTMVFAGQNTVEFSGANYSAEAFVPIDPYKNFVDEIIYFTDRPEIVNSFKTRYDDVWTTTTGYRNYANVTGDLQRSYPAFPIDPDLNFVPYQNFRSRSVARYKAEPASIDAVMYRITDRAHSDAMIAAVARGVPVRLITEPAEYRSAVKPWTAWNVDRMYIAGVQVRLRSHQGLTHEKLTLLAGQGLAIFGSSNWTSASAESQLEHNLFTADPNVYAWARAHFDRKWNNTNPYPDTKAFTPLPPDTPVLKAPASGATGQTQSVTLAWYAGPWAHKYDLYLGTDATHLTKVLDDRELGPSESSSDLVRWTVSGLNAGTTYYWKVTGRTMANLARTSAVAHFTTAGTGGGTSGSTLPSGWSSRDVGNVGAAGSASADSGTYTLSGSGADIWGTADEFRFAYMQLTGDGSIVARVATEEAVNAWTKAGVMIRSDLSASSAHAMMIVSPGKGLAFQRRVTAGGSSVHTSGGTGTAPRWVRLQRAGNVITAAVSQDGSTWTTVGHETVTMPSTVYAGLVVSSHVDGTLARVTFDHVSVGP